MKRSILAALALCGMLSAAIPASAYTVNGGTVGGLETFIASGDVNSGDVNEVNWVNTALHNYYGGTFNFTKDDLTKYNTPDGAGWVNTDQYTTNERVVAYELETSPQYFYIKTGNLSSGVYQHFLFANNDSFDWAVLDLDESFGPGYSIEEIGKFSHTGELGETPVPEPGTFILLGAGLLGLAAYGRKRIRK